MWTQCVVIEVRKYLAIALVLASLPLLAALLSSLEKTLQWSGTDSQAKGKVAELAPGYKPWLSPVWEPSSPKVETFLFSLQAALGVLVAGYILYRLSTQKS